MKKIYKNFNLIIYLTGIFISGIGTKLTTIALADKILKLTENDFSISLVYVLESLPVLIFGMLAGNIIDKRNKKTTFIIINLISGLTSLIFALTGNISVIFIVIFINGIIKSFYTPVSTSLMPLMVQKEDLTEANGLKMSVGGIIMISGYAFAGILLGAAGNTTAFVIDSLSFVFIAAISLFIKIKRDGIQVNNHQHKNYRQDLTEGWNFIKNSTILKHMFILDLIINLIISMQTPLTYIFTEKYLGGSLLMAKRTALLFSFAGIGTMAGGIILGKFKNKNKLILFSASLIFDSFLAIAFSVNRYFPFSLLIFAGMGIVGAFSGSILQTVIQENTPEIMLGRVSGLINSVSDPLSVLSLLLGGIFAGLIEVKWIFIAGSLLELTAAIFFIKKYGK